ncbi:OmpA family protein [Cellulomonas composti]|uniref:OmpA-like domain-containing protein n=1 Tax=Cellulomonas composti TaxID=266130 RepID=A0A511JD99_9CELL|nr:OmpA family protein [Cellulomonas composti]GEL95970.1 hypothetical protein CCO02nite_26280 [Cellulomonas composti]
MSTISTRLLAAAAAVVAAALLAGCASGTAVGPSAQADCPTAPALALVVPVHQNAQEPGVPQEWDCALDRAIRDGAPISVVTAEGRPQVLLKGFRADVSADNPQAVEDDVVAAKNTVIASVASASASSAGNDLLGAVALAADLAPGGQILSLDNGTTDTGVVRTADEGMTTLVDPADVAQLVVDRGACPAVEGARVQLYSLGYQVAPAEPISTRQRTRVAQTWESVLVACGAEVAAVALPRTGEGPAGAYTTRAIAPEADPAMPALAAASSCEATLPDAVVGFVADEATLLSPADARSAVAAAARQLAACSGDVQVVGTTSSAGTEAGRAALSARRAEAVRDLLADALGVPAGAIAATGLGYDEGPLGGCVVDRVDGVLDPALAAQNRKVVIRIGG